MIQELLRTVNNILFIPVCFICEKKLNKSEIICIDCMRTIRYQKIPQCRVCAKEIDAPSTCNACKNISSYNNALLGCTKYTPPTSTLIQMFKYRHYDYLAPFFARIMAVRIKTIRFPLYHYDALCPVPSHPLRKREREYNQSELLARALSGYLNIPYKDDIISCINYRQSQTQLTRSKRHINVRNIFSAGKKAFGKNILLIDDVITSGSTTNECAKTLKMSGANTVSTLTLAKAQ